ncbi:MAG: hypothetical protein KC503_33520 [Myxococcales bacterium]|nr:hypothetical protein [Myxococcales bacterium]
MSATTIAVASFLLLVAAGAVAPAPARADCAAKADTFSPPRGARDVPTNVKPFIALYGYGRAQVVKLLRAGAYLRAKGHRVKVTPRAYTGYATESVVLSPASALRPNTTYSLDVTTPQGARLLSYSFTTGASRDTRAPGSPSPRNVKHTYTRFGCGPADRIAFELAGALSDDKTPAKALRLRFDVVERAPGRKPHKRVVVALPGSRSLGHGMCAGNAELRPCATYDFRVSVVDYAGNISAPSPKLSVKTKCRRTP